MLQVGQSVGRWKALKELGRGGQGRVFLVEDVQATEPETMGPAFRKVIAQMAGAGDGPTYRAAEQDFIELVRKTSKRPIPRALKYLYPMEDADRQSKARERMRSELKVMGDHVHSALVRLIDSDPDDSWFVMPYYRRGPLTGHLKTYAGRPVHAIEALIPVVEAVAELHDRNVVHRDIKPDNIFVAKDGSLVLGDMGLAFTRGRSDELRLTGTFENVGSRDWMPGWAYGQRQDEVKPSFDVFALGKVLWAAVAGVPNLRLWYHREETYDLEKRYPDRPEMTIVNRILDGAVVEHERQVQFQTASDLLSALRQALATLRRAPSLIDARGPQGCAMCGIGIYLNVTDNEEAQRHYRNLGLVLPTSALDSMKTHLCPACGHVAVFLVPSQEKPLLWKK